MILLHGLSLVLPLTTLSFVLFGPGQGTLALAWLAVLPLLALLDRWSGQALPPSSGSAHDRAFTGLLYGLAALQLLNFVLALRYLGHRPAPAAPVPVIELVVLTVLVGVGSAYSSLVVAHELIHRPRATARLTGRALLASLLYDHFFVEHLRGHHLNVATARDATTARFDEPLGSYLLRAWPAEWRNAWRLEARRLEARLGSRRLEAHPLEARRLETARRLLGSTVLHGLLAELALAAVVLLVAGWVGLVVLVAQAALAQLLTMLVNYFEHWGLERRAPGRVTAAESWQSDSVFTQFALFGLARHADHHLRSGRPYQALEWHEASPRLPRGFVNMIPLVLFQNRRARGLLAAELRRKGLVARGPGLD